MNGSASFAATALAGDEDCEGCVDGVVPDDAHPTRQKTNANGNEARGDFVTPQFVLPCTERVQFVPVVQVPET